MLGGTTVMPRAIISRSNCSGNPLTSTAMIDQPTDEQATM